jgi:hypothetical protein
MTKQAISPLRKKILAEAADSGRLVVPAHFRGPRREHIRASTSGYEPVFGIDLGESG